MLGFVIYTVIIIFVTLGMERPIRKYWNQLRPMFSKYIYWILALIFLFLFGLLIGSLTNSEEEELRK